ncbi:hypothetical protein LPJ75_000738, partial [Coemansia sp. RSA 2598]
MAPTLADIRQVCRTWSHSTRRYISQHLCLTASRCLSQKQINSNAPRLANIDTSLASIISGEFVNTHMSQGITYWNVDTLCINVTSPRPKDIVQLEANEAEIQQSANNLCKRLTALFPNARRIQFELTPHRSAAWTALTSTLYTKLLQRIQANNRLREIPRCISTFVSHGMSLSTQHMPAIGGGLTKISIGMVTWSEDGIVETIHRNAQTLQTLSIKYSRSTQTLGFIVSSEGMSIVYPQLEFLSLGVYAGVAIPNRFTCGFQPFPNLTTLELPGVYPFANSILLDNAKKRYKSMSLAVSSHFLDSFKHARLFASTDAFEQLQYLEINALPIDDPFLFPGDLVDDGLLPRNIATCIDLVLSAYESGVPSIKLDLGSSLNPDEFIQHIKAAKAPLTKKLCSLDLGSTKLTMLQAKTLLSTLPDLSVFKYSSQGCDPEDHAVIDKDAVALSEITVTIDAVGLSLQETAQYLASLCVDLSSLLRVNVIGKAAYNFGLLDAFRDVINEDQRYLRSPQTDHLHS